ncbi:copper resistance protein B [Novosphingobium aquimarinum]|uniref:copper resistance protein B n=1 Tax=Novosphingobium aquimarinum TaxID=2682494 RepID=UPI001E3360B0|nr:copper resistance protein B [Novosphingobium aquimarinum]
MSAHIVCRAALALGLAVPQTVLAQHDMHAQHQGHAEAASDEDGEGHDMHSPDAPSPAHGEPAMDHGHGTMDHGAMDHEAMDHEAMDHGTMDHGSMDHGAMNHGTAGSDALTVSPGPTMETPPPPEAGSGPPLAADAIWGADAMRDSREAIRRNNGSFPLLWIQGDRLETQVREGRDGYLWDLQGYYGTPTDRLWLKSEGEGTYGAKVEDAEIQALYSKAIKPFWDLQAGVRQDLVGPERTYAVLGIQGLAPYQFELDAALFLSQRGDLTARIEGELDQRITQYLTLQPRVEVELSAQDIPELGIGSGLSTIEAGLRLRYQIAREFAPYLGVEQSWAVGRSADYRRADGEDTSVTNYVVGVRFWF